MGGAVEASRCAGSALPGAVKVAGDHRGWALPIGPMPERSLFYWARMTGREVEVLRKLAPQTVSQGANW